MKKILVFNALAVVLFLTPVIYLELSTHTCVAGNMGVKQTHVWKASSKNLKEASKYAQSMCDKNSQTPEKCFILSCEQSIFK